MGAFTNFMEDQIVEVFLRKASKTGGDIYVALFTTDPGETGGGTEASYTGYARQLATWSPFDQGLGQVSNANALGFPPNGNAVNSVIVTHLGLMTSIGGTDMLLYAPLTAPKTLSPGDVLSFAIGSIVFGIN